MPKEFQFIRVRLKTEQHRLLNLAHVINISEDDRSLDKSVKLNRHLLNDILHEMECLLAQFLRIDSRYQPALVELREEKTFILHTTGGTDRKPLSGFQKRFPGDDHEQ